MTFFAILFFLAFIVVLCLSFLFDSCRAALRVVSIVCLVLAVLMSSIAYVPTGYTGIVKRLGVIQNYTLDAGVSLKVPIIDTVITMDNREQRHTFNLDAFSHDIQEVTVTGSVNMNINKATAMSLYKEVGEGYFDVLVAPRVLEDCKVIISNYSAEQLVENRSVLSDEITTMLQNDLTSKGINIISISLENLDFSDVFTDAVEAKQVATQEKQRAETEQERQTMEAEQAAERSRIAAEAEADVAKIEADAEAYAIQAKAEAEAAANEKLNASLTEYIIEYNKVQQWNGELPSVVSDASALPVIGASEWDTEDFNTVG